MCVSAIVIKRTIEAQAYADQSNPLQSGKVCSQFKDAEISEGRATGQIDISKSGTAPCQVDHSFIRDAGIEKSANSPQVTFTKVIIALLANVTEMQEMDVLPEFRYAQNACICQAAALRQNQIPDMGHGDYYSLHCLIRQADQGSEI
jgi:hypothetical protein